MRPRRKIIKGKKGDPAQRKEEGFYDQNNPILPLEKKNECLLQTNGTRTKKGVSSFPFKPVKPIYNKIEEDRW